VVYRAVWLITDEKDKWLICVLFVPQWDYASEIWLPCFAWLLEVKALFNVAMRSALAKKPSVAISMVLDQINNVVWPRLFATF
jgi:hypothetical protein